MKINVPHYTSCCLLIGGLTIIHLMTPAESIPSPGQTLDKDDEDPLLVAASQSTSYTIYGKNSIIVPSSSSSYPLGSGTAKSIVPPPKKSSLGTPTMPPTPAPAEDSDKCSGRPDGYYPNLSSGCKSYFFCSAGYQMTYICPPGQKFNVDKKKCQRQYKECPNNKNITPDPCSSKPQDHGYYSYEESSPKFLQGKYFYCHDQIKVIELQCDAGKVFKDDDKCQYLVPPRTSLSENKEPQSSKDNTEASCTGSTNGFYPMPKTNCTQYYYCIKEEMTKLRCEEGYVFNGDLCVIEGRYRCPQ